MTPLTYQPLFFEKFVKVKKQPKTSVSTIQSERPFDFDLARLQDRIEGEIVEVPHFDKKQDLLDWIKNGE